jgi:hypothetical protein
MLAQRRILLMKFLVTTLSVCLLGFLLGCVFNCADHIEDSTTRDAHSINATCTDEDCPVTYSAASTLPERSFLSILSILFDDNLSQPSQDFHFEIISDSTRRLHFASLLDPPLERLAVLRI